MLRIETYQDFKILPGWLETAAGLQGRSVSRMALLILGLSQKAGKRSVVIRRSNLEEINFNRITAYKALNKLDKAGLIRVHRRRRNPPWVEILDHQT